MEGRAGLAFLKCDCTPAGRSGFCFWPSLDFWPANRPGPRRGAEPPAHRRPLRLPPARCSAAFAARKASRISSSVKTSLASSISETGSQTSCGSSSLASSRRSFSRAARSSPSIASMMPRNRLRPPSSLWPTAHFDPRLLADGPDEIGSAHQRPVDSRRRNLQPIGALHRIIDIEHRRQRLAHSLAIRDRHAAVGALRHHLHRGAGLPRKLHPHQAVAEIGQDRHSQMRDPGGDPRLGRKARLVQAALVCVGVQDRAPRALSSSRLWRSSGNKKERVPGGPLSNANHLTMIVMRRKIGLSYAPFRAIPQGRRPAVPADETSLGLSVETVCDSKDTYAGGLSWPKQSCHDERFTPGQSQGAPATLNVAGSLAPLTAGSQSGQSLRA